MIQVIDNLIPLSYQEEIKSLLLSNMFPWFYVDDVTNPNTLPEDKTPAFATLLRSNCATHNNYYNYFLPIAHLGAAAVNYKFNDVYQCRTFLQLPLSKVNPVDPLHVDSELEHLVVLYYVLDSDGDTIIVDKKLQTGESHVDNLRSENFNVLKRVTPKQGRAVIFDGRYYHTAEQPRGNKRCVINFNVI